MPPLEHPKPSDTPDVQGARVRFEIEDSSLGDAEVLWGRPVTPDVMRLDNIPLLIFGVSMGDEVHVRRRDSGLFDFTAIARHGGHSTYRVMLDDPDDPSAQERLRDVVTMGCPYEQLTPRFLALDVPPDVDVFAVHERLEQGLDVGAWTFEEGHCGHPTNRG